MKITAFILSILLSTTALAENRANQYSDVSTMEIRAQIEHAIADGRIRVIEMEADEAVEAIKLASDRGDITEEQESDLIRLVGSIDTASNDGSISVGRTNELSHTPENKCQYPSSFMGYKYNTNHALLGVLLTVIGVGNIPGPIPLVPIGGPGGVLVNFLLYTGGGAIVGAIVGRAFDRGDDACEQ